MDPLADFGVAVAAQTTTSLLAETKKQIGYLYKYKQHLKSLEDAEEKLDAKRKDASRFAEDNNRKQKDVGSTAALWKAKADKLHQKAQKILSENNISCLHPWSRHSTSKHALEIAQEINKEVQTAPDFGAAFDRPTPKLGAKFDLTGFTEFESRASVVNDVWEALKDENVRMCSICGMGGTGKTTLVKKLIRRVEDDRIFDKVAMATVSQNPNPMKIREDIASSLVLKFESKDLETSNKLIDCLTNNDESILLILDDVWEEFDFEVIGLPKARFKILLTSRKEDVCQRMGSERNYVINVLIDEEARGLFKDIAIESIEKWKLHDIARKIADECGGLPIVIVTLAAALKYEIKATWDDSLLKLQKSNLLGISGMEKVYSRIKLSYDLLNDPEAQACFRLCCLWPEDHSVPIGLLVFYGKGLQLFEYVESMKQASDRVESIIAKLKKSFLLLEGKDSDTVKMHDILRDFAISISSKDRHSYIVGCEKVMKKWPETSRYENRSIISFVCDRIEEYPVDLRCPKLELLQVVLYHDPVGLPIGIFEGLKELTVLILYVPFLSQPLTTLRKLRTLIIYESQRTLDKNARHEVGCVIGQGDLKNLEILEWSSNVPWFDFPEEIGLLCNLRCLKFGSVRFKYMPPTVLPKLVNLEELELSREFCSWGCKEVEGERFNAGLNEIESLPLLTRLNISIQDGSILAEKLVNNLTRFVVRIGNQGDLLYDNSSARSGVSGVDASDVEMTSMKVLLRKCERYEWESVHNVKNIVSLQSSQDNVFPQWKDIDIGSCPEMEYLVDTIMEQIPSSFFSQLETLTLSDMPSMEEICPFSKIEAPCFTNLRRIKITKCDELKHLFPLSVARDLRQLQSLTIQNASSMQEIFYRDGVDDGNQPQVLSNVELLNPSTSINAKFMSPTPNSCIQGLIGREKQTKMVSSPQIMEGSVAKVDRAITDAIIFPRLKTLDLQYMDNLITFYDGNHAIELPSLEELIIKECNKIKALSYGSFNAPCLREIQINGSARYQLSSNMRGS